MNFRGRTDVILHFLFFAGCAKHTPKPLLMPKIIPQEKNGLVVRAELLDNQAWKSTWDVKTPSPQKYGYEPIQVAINNNSPHPYELKTNSMRLTLASVKKVLAKMHRKNRILNSTAIAIGGALFIPLSPAFAIGWGIGSFIPLALPVKLDSEAKMIMMSCGETFRIEPNDLLNRIMFVKTSNYATTFKLLLINKETGVIETFMIHLNDLAEPQALIGVK